MQHLQNVRIPGLNGLQQVLIEAEHLTHISPKISPSQAPNAVIEDWNGDWLSLGGIDLQINGALGLAFPELQPETLTQLTAIGKYLWQAGVDAYCPTIVTTSIANIHRSLSLIKPYQAQTPSTEATILGVHLEGPCLNPSKRGAHPAEHLQPLTIAQMQAILGDYSDMITYITLAPELDPSGEVIAFLHDRGIRVSLGHSEATAAEAHQAFSQGASLVTHAFNAMPPLHHREPGLLGAAIVHPQVMCGFIADGQHIDRTMLQILLQANAQGLFLVSDALAPLGLPDGRYPWDERQITVTHGTARLDDGTLSGTTLSLLQGVQNLIQWHLCDIPTAIDLATLAPRRAIGQSTNLLNQSVHHLLRWTPHPSHGLQWSRLTKPMPIS
jgi:N-acetylglucosamine-6-phosphate deacetylase